MKTSVVFAIDPGTTQSAWLLWIDDRPWRFGIESNETLLQRLTKSTDMGDITVAIEEVASYGMAVGREVFDTVHWAGRFFQAAQPAKVVQVTRLEVKMHLCHNATASDANIRAALIDQFGGSSAAIGLKKTPGPLYGITKDVWSALAIAVTVKESTAHKEKEDAKQGQQGHQGRRDGLRRSHYTQHGITPRGAS